MSNGDRIGFSAFTDFLYNFLLLLKLNNNLSFCALQILQAAENAFKPSNPASLLILLLCS